MILLILLALENVEPFHIQLPDLGGGALEQFAQSMIWHIRYIELRIDERPELHLDYGVHLGVCVMLDHRFDDK